ncbi:prenyltransferase [Pseudoalteromonas phenolica]|uniref:UbiA prenyltransferase n=1 Tax=Pseudoalteromonas phenolica TaxID=161398 RepID=A0A0S2K6J0_9GAMM|nr:prenyltransferase [Pseudoalteromonas phenolica]ALO43926.1 UbiA prenyltransferase [Pseudoalteromonas phenolica]MBE0356897.1 1,4-dihydroxy-2-naphthoate octaprenyltransferase [Pseudoalteromonas phenolica O-BC30]RXF04592.1 prenyltransferase [Pseudoalteromonas phenolica O-BC30]
MKNFISALPSTRPPFLLLAPLCVLLGNAIAQYHGAEFHGWHFLFACMGSVLSAVAVNTLNEYQDFHSGLDLITKRTPFSGGSGLLKQNSALEKSVLSLFQLALGSLFLIGIYFVYRFGLPMLTIGLLGLAVIITYTNTLNRHPWLCLISPGLGFALLMVLGSYITQGLTLNWQVLLIALIPFFTINNLLLVNQLPDIKADQQVGRKHFAIYYSVNAAVICFSVSAALALLLMAIALYLAVLPFKVIWLTPILLLNFLAIPKLAKLKHDIAKHPQSMALNVVAANLLPLVLSVILLLNGPI